MVSFRRIGEAIVWKQPIFFLFLLLFLNGCGPRYVQIPAPPRPTPIIHETTVCDQIQDEATKIRRAFLEARNTRKSGELISLEEIVAKDEVESARFLMELGPGLITLKGGSPELLTAGLSYVRGDRVPELISMTAGRTRRVEVLGGGRYDTWDFLLNERLPIGIIMETGHGVRDLNFDNIYLTDLELEGSSGATLLEIPGEQPYFATLSASQVRGPMQTSLPGNYPLLSSVFIETGYGNISTSFTGYFTRLQHIELGTTSGDVEVDLRGFWRRNCDVRIMATGGNCQIFVPRGLGISVKIKGRGIRIYAPCMTRKWSSDSYINDAYGKTDTFLDIEVESTCGHQVDIIQLPR